MNTKLYRIFSFLLAMTLAFGFLQSVQAAPAYIPATWTVTKTADTNDGACNADCSLREAIAVAAGGDTVVFDVSLSGQSIYLGSTLTIGKNLTIDGSALASKITVSGDTGNNGTPDVRVFYINAGFTVTLDSLIVKKGKTTDHGAGIYNDGGTLTVTNSVVTENVSTNNAGGIYNTNSGTLTVSNSTVSNNTATYNGGGIHSNITMVTVTNSVITGNSAGGQGGGGIRTFGGMLVVTNSTISNNTGSGIANQSNTLQISGSTFSGNSGVNYGGAIFTQFSSVSVTNSTFFGNTADNGGGMMLFSSDSVTVKNSTFSNNTANAANTGGGIYNYGSTLHLINTIIANSPSGGDCRNAATIGTNTNNLYEDGNTSCGTPSVSGDPNLGVLANNGGSTLTMELLPGSPAVNAGNDASCAASPVNGVDQRGVTRPQGAHCDIGAYEAAAPFDTMLSNSNQNENTAIGTTIGTLSTSDPDPSDTHTYSLACSIPGADDASFTISGNTLKNAVSFDYEVKSSYSVCVRTTDSGGLTYDETHSITVNDINEAPVITSGGGGATADVNAPEHGTAVTTITASDQDTGATQTYSITGGADQAKFSLHPSTGVLTFLAAPNFEVPGDANVDNVYEVTVQVSDGSLTDSQAISVTVTNILEVAPTNISLSNNSLAENLPSGTTIGTLTSTDADLNDTFAYSFCGGADDASFQISGDALQSSASFNFESKSSYSFCVRSTDSGGQTFDKNFTVNVTNVNEAPTNIPLSNANVTEGLPVGTTVGTLSATDPDAGDSHTFALACSTPGADDASFQISGSALQTNAVFNFETKNSYAICVRATDGGSLTFDENLTVTINPANEAPVITSNGSGATANINIAENTTAITTVTATDPDAGTTLTYSIIGGVDMAFFSINPSTGALTLNYTPDFENPVDPSPTNALGVVVQVSDGQLTDTQSILVTVTNVNEAPTNVSLSNSSVTENLPVGTVVGTLSTTDPDSGNTHTYSFCGGADDASFTLSGNSLQTTVMFNFEAKNSYSICVRSTDGGSLFFNKNLVISVLDVTGLELVSPADSALLLFNRPTFDWNDYAGATGYQIQVARDAGFTQLVINVTTNNAVSNYTPTSDLPVGTALFWRVRARTGLTFSAYSLTRTLTSASPPSTPVLVAPAENALLTDFTPTFDWNDSSLPSFTAPAFHHYQIQVAPDSGFTALILDDVTATGFATASAYTPVSDLPAGTTLHWRVRAVNIAGQYSNWAQRSFRTGLLPPNLVSPGVASGPVPTIPTRRPTFVWDAVPGATSYTIEVRNSASTVIFTANTSQPNYTHTADLAANTAHTWRVKANGATGSSAFSSSFSFVSGNPPSVPTLTAPANNSLALSYLPVTFDWTDSTSPAGVTLSHYQIQIATDNAFTNIIHDHNTTSSLDTDAILNPATTYFWRVRAFGSNGHYSGWSSVFSVKVSYVRPILLGPANLSTVASLKPVFTWSAVTGATGYTIQISRYNTFPALQTTSANVASPTYTPTTNLLARTTYYWRVTATGPYGPITSVVFSFTTP